MNTTSPHLAGPIVLLKRTLASYRKNAVSLIKIMSVQIWGLLAILAVNGYVVMAGLENQRGNAAQMTAVACVLIPLIVLSSLFQALSKIALIQRLHDIDKDIPFKGIMDALKGVAPKFWAYVWMSILLMVVMVPLALLLGIPAIIFSVFFLFTPYVLLQDNQKGLHALVASWHYARGNWWKIFGRMLFLGLCVGVVCAAALILMVILYVLIVLVGHMAPIPMILDIPMMAILMFFLMPCIFIYMYEMFKNLKHIRGEYTHTPAELKKRTILKVLGIIGAVLLPVLFIGGISAAILQELRHDRRPVGVMSDTSSQMSTYGDEYVIFSYPSTWKAERPTQAGVVGVKITSPNGVGMTLSEVMLSADEQAETSAMFVGADIDNFKQAHKGDPTFHAYPIENDVTVGGEKASRVLFTWSESVMSQKVPVAADLVIVRHGDKAFYLGYFDTPQGLITSEDTFYDIVKSVKFK